MTRQEMKGQQIERSAQWLVAASILLRYNSYCVDLANGSVEAELVLRVVLLLQRLKAGDSPLLVAVPF